jgi:hypothetical protein
MAISLATVCRENCCKFAASPSNNHASLAPHAGDLCGCSVASRYAISKPLLRASKLVPEKEPRFWIVRSGGRFLVGGVPDRHAPEVGA